MQLNIRNLENRITLLENLAEANDKLNTSTRTNALRDQAERMAIKSILKEICSKLDVDPSVFSTNLETRTNIFHDSLLKTLEDKSPRRAGELDQRTNDQIPEEEKIPPLFQ